MITAFKAHIRQKNLLDVNKTYLLACSGGLDSVVLGELLLESGFSFEVAHVNFQLRGKESEGDEKFVAKWAEQKSLEFHLKRVDAGTFAEDQKISIQMAARKLRYEWFEFLRKARNLAGIILAHHEDDQIETVFLNLLRGTGLDGLQGMAERNGHLIRPLLVFSRDELEEFAQSNNIKWREDSSNQKTDYKRNKLRLEVLPKLYGSTPEAKKNLLTSLTRIKDSTRAFGGLYEQWLEQTVRLEDDTSFLPLSKVMNMPGAVSLIFLWIRSFGFNSDQAESIYQAAKSGEVGKLFSSSTHLLNLDRDELILMPQGPDFKAMEISENEIEIHLPDTSYDLLKLASPATLDTHRSNAMLDLEQLEFPLVIRNWVIGDRFIPLGMKNSKKVSDFLIDLKIPLAQKSKIKVLVSGGKIAWVIGLRIADWAKYDASTRKIIYFKQKVHA
ncbi:tRNA lysidine(34) synthetase TilS [Algoriphagus hitonicola]|uniref:tRNA(Ile)-lysidine synthase n=1 Tax=Algoriphagus hitonicola TaxID=435880 RepID=A0A1I2UC59_9BACT|nr:tRNA lysidine(34) synthetase TilS [Algoriphagus hitonicola]SFG74618.1 tRNA(Ile)-lysidine synthase [Algoriphagus hitonicola]